MSGGFGALERLFAEARRLPVERRAEFLASECGGDDALRREIEELLRIDGAAGAGDAARDPFAEPALGAGFVANGGEQGRIGRYRLLGTLGAGGMGVVHLAEQDQPRRIVALKLLRPGLVARDAELRFRREAEALGQLRHPGIAQVFEAGVADGVPFISMERVSGPPLLEFVERERLDRRERLELFCRICDAVQHAHDNGVIHRDLKPSNVLVEGTRAAPRPKVLDFGVARVTGSDPSLATLHTRPGELLGTLPYMSPEQARGRQDEIDERADVHALGAMLFELLTGRLPRDLRGRPLPEAARVLAEEEPTTLSSVDAALAGDLDTITATALARERERRYPSAAALAGDVRLHLADRPIHARPTSAADQLRKFARRHRALVAGGAIAFTLLAAGLAATAWQWRRAVAETETADRRFDELRHLARTFIFDLDPKLRQLAGALDARRTIVKNALEYLDRLAAEAPDRPALRLELAAAYQNMGDVQGSATLPNLGDARGALASYRKAYTLLEALDRDGRDRGDSIADLVTVGLRIGDATFDVEGPAAAESRYRDVEALLARWRRAVPDDPRIEPCSDQTSERIGNALLALGKPEDALVLYREALARSERTVAEHPADRDARRCRAVALTKVAACDFAAGRNDAALAGRIEALRAFTALADEDPHDVVSRRDVAVSEEQIGQILIAVGRAEESEAHFFAALTMTEDLARADPEDARVRADLATHLCRVGERRLAAGDLAGASERFDRLLGVAEQLAREQPEAAAALRQHGVALYKQSELEHARVDAASDDATRRAHASQRVEWLERALAVFRDLRMRGMLAEDDADVPHELESELESARRDA